MIIIFLMWIFFSVELDPIEMDKLDNSVIIVCDNLYCKECLYNISSLQYLWKSDYKTVLVTKSVKNKQSTVMLSKMFAEKIDYDDIYFKESKNRLGFDSFEILDNKIDNTPSIILIGRKKKIYLSYKQMFHDIPNDSTHLKKLLLEKLSQI